MRVRIALLPIGIPCRRPSLQSRRTLGAVGGAVNATLAAP